MMRVISIFFYSNDTLVNKVKKHVLSWNLELEYMNGYSRLSGKECLANFCFSLLAYNCMSIWHLEYFLQATAIENPV